MVELIVEDGSIVAGATSYCSVDDYRTYMSARGYEVPLDCTRCSQHLTKAMDYLEAQRAKFKGAKVSPTQPLQWPRRDVWIDDALWPYTAIPRELQYAQMALALEEYLGNELMPTILPGAPGPIIREKVDVIEVQYADMTGKRQKTPAFAKAEALLAPLLKHNGLSSVTLVRA